MELLTACCCSFSLDLNSYKGRKVSVLGEVLVVFLHRFHEVINWFLCRAKSDEVVHVSNKYELSLNKEAGIHFALLETMLKEALFKVFELGKPAVLQSIEVLF